MLKQTATRFIKTVCISTLIISTMNVALATSDEKKAEVLADIKTSVAESIQTAVVACQPNETAAAECKKGSPVLPSKKQAYVENCIEQTILRCVGNKLLADNPLDDKSK